MERVGQMSENSLNYYLFACLIDHNVVSNLIRKKNVYSGNDYWRTPPSTAKDSL